MSRVGGGATGIEVHGGFGGPAVDSRWVWVILDPIDGTITTLPDRRWPILLGLLQTEFRWPADLDAIHRPTLYRRGGWSAADWAAAAVGADAELANVLVGVSMGTFADHGASLWAIDWRKAVPSAEYRGCACTGPLASTVADGYRWCNKFRGHVFRPCRWPPVAWSPTWLGNRPRSALAGHRACMPRSSGFWQHRGTRGLLRCMPTVTFRGWEFLRYRVLRLDVDGRWSRDEAVNEKLKPRLAFVPSCHGGDDR